MASKKKPLSNLKIHKGGLHKSLGIPSGKKIPKSLIRKAAHRPGKVGKQARLAEVFDEVRKERHKHNKKAQADHKYSDHDKD